jgi:MoaA/NifB/PqqE/SkfB family radical SAM enzyme
MPNRLQYLMMDFVVQEHVCNLRCSYCLNFENENLKPGKPWQPTERITLKPGEFGWQRAHRVLERCRELSDAPILRLAGGELMAIGGALDFIEEVAADWDRIQVLTNATFLARDIDRLARLPNLNLCCSVDGHTAKLNEQRTGNAKWAMRIVDGLRAAVDAGVPVEIYTVLSATNVEGLYDFADWVRALPRRADVRLFPFPVRGEAARGHLFQPSQTGAIRRLRSEYEDFAEILPPPAFIDRLLIMAEGAPRKWRCRVPLSFVQSFDDGVIAACSNCWAAPLGNVIEDATTFDRIGRANIHKLFLRTPPRVSFCTGCFTPFDVVNVFLDGDCSVEEMSRMNLYGTPAVQARLIALRGAWENGSTRPLTIDETRQPASEPGRLADADIAR